MRGRPKDPARTEQILQAASDLFLAQGLKGASMDAVSKEASVSKQTLYSHFKNKDDLYCGVMRWKLTKYQFYDETVNLTGNIEDDLNILGTHFLNLILDPEAVAMFRIVISESTSYKKTSRLFYENGPEKVINNLSTYFEEYNIKEPRFNAVTFTNMLDGEWHMKSIMGLQKKPSDEEIKAFVSKIVKKFLKSLYPCNQ
jgi:TetR/AcrR family transcriptional repressor of mexJK operon